MDGSRRDYGPVGAAFAFIEGPPDRHPTACVGVRRRFKQGESLLSGYGGAAEGFVIDGGIVEVGFVSDVGLGEWL